MGAVVTPVQPLPGVGNQVNQNMSDRERRGKHTEFFGEPTAGRFQREENGTCSCELYLPSFTVTKTSGKLGSWEAQEPTISL